VGRFAWGDVSLNPLRIQWRGRVEIQDYAFPRKPNSRRRSPKERTGGSAFNQPQKRVKFSTHKRVEKNSSEPALLAFLLALLLALCQMAGVVGLELSRSIQALAVW
jgi:hypothetical protein